MSTDPTSNRSEVRDFLHTRRAKITPEQAGLTVYGGNRRVSGLRREEVAMLAGVSADYYTRLEKGNLSGASESVLDAIAGALQLGEAERQHLTYLARAANARPVRAARTFYPDFHESAGTSVALLRTEAGRDPYNKALTELIGELSTRSDEFRACGLRTTFASTTPVSNAFTIPRSVISNSASRP